MSVLYRYLLSYFSVILLSCAVIGLFLFNASIRELNATTKRDIQNKLSLISNDLENQQSIMADIALNIATTIYYKPFYRERNKVCEIDLLNDFAKYDKRSPIADDYFLFYKDDDWVFKKNAKNTFSVYASSILGLFDSAALYEKLNGIGEFSIILPEDGSSDWLLIAYPVPISGIAQPSDYACLCFVTHAHTLAKRFTDVAGKLPGSIEVRSNGRSIAFLPGPDGTATPNDETLLAVSPQGMFSVAMADIDNVYDGLDYFLWINLGIVVVFVILFLGLSAFLAYSNFRPLKELTAKYDISCEAAREQKNEIWRIDSLLKRALEDQRLSKAHLHEQFLLLKRQQLLLLLNGGYRQDSGNQGLPDLPFPGNAFGVLVIWTKGAPQGGPEVLCRLIEDLSGDGMVYYVVELEGGRCFAVLSGLQEESRLAEAIELIGAVLEASGIGYSLGIGSFYQDINYLPASLLTAISQNESARVNNAMYGNDGSSPDVRWYDDGTVVRMIAGIRSGNCNEAKENLELFINGLKESALSLLMRRCVFLDMLNAVIRTSYEMRLAVAQERISPLLVSQDPSTCREGMLSIISDICRQAADKNVRRSAKALNDILSYIREHSLEYDLSHERVARHFGLSDNHLYRIIKEGTGKTYKDYLTHLRICQAQSFLVGENLSVAETCQRVGYTSIPHFIKTFKFITGYTPANYKIMKKSSGSAN